MSDFEDADQSSASSEEDTDSGGGLAFVDVFASALGAVTALVLVLVTMDRSPVELRQVRRLQVTAMTKSDENLSLELEVFCRIPGQEGISRLEDQHFLEAGNDGYGVPYLKCDVFHKTGNSCAVWISNPIPGDWTITDVTLRGNRQGRIDIDLEVKLENEEVYRGRHAGFELHDRAPRSLKPSDPKRGGLPIVTVPRK